MSKKNNGWISVKDRLPDENQEVIVVVNNPIIESRIAIYLNNGLFAYEIEHIGSSEWNVSITDRVTHWQPLAQPPEE